MKTVRPKKALGQHFLTDLDVASRIADSVDAAPELPVLEVGPGMGVLTQFLVRKGRELKVVEIDDESVSYLLRTYPELEESIIADDFLKMHLARTFGGRPFLLTGNYPYNISSQIFFKVLDNRELVPVVTGMIQKEVADRICAGPGTKTYGILSVLLQAWYDTEYLFTVEPHVFNPPPKVRSAVVRLTRNGRMSLGCNEELFRRVVKTTFNQRRKTLRNNLKPLLAELGVGLPPADSSEEAVATGARGSRVANIDGRLLALRPEQLALEQFLEITKEIEKAIAPAPSEQEG